MAPLGDLGQIGNFSFCVHHDGSCREVAIYPRDIRLNNPTEALIVEQALAMYREMQRVANAAPDGQVLAQAETVAVSQGRELTRKSLDAVRGGFLRTAARFLERKASVAKILYHNTHLPGRTPTGDAVKIGWPG